MIRDQDDHQQHYERLPWQPNNSANTVVGSNTNQPDPSCWAMTGIAYPGKHDVMLGRGGESNYHAGNLTFRSFIQEHKIRYQKARKQEKPIIALEVVLAWRDLSPPGRFLARIDPSRADSLWEDVGDEQACKRAGRTLGEKCSGSKSSSSGGNSSNSNKGLTNAKAQDNISSNSRNGDEESLKVRGVVTRSPGASLDGRHSGNILAAHRKRTHKNEKSSPTKPRRPQASLDFIASLTSRNVLSNSAPQHHQRYEKLEPSKKKRRLMDGSSPVMMGAPPSPESIASSNSSSNDKKPSPIVSPESRVKLWPGNRETSMLEVGSSSAASNDRARLSEDLPTAEFLTQTAFLD